MSIVKFPSWRYCITGESGIVRSQAESDLLGKTWRDAPWPEGAVIEPDPPVVVAPDLALEPEPEDEPEPVTLRLKPSLRTLKT